MLITIGETETVSVAEAADYLEMTDEYIRRLCREGKIKSRKRLNHRREINREDLLAFRRERELCQSGL